MISGPDATAGSTFILWKKIGMIVPIKLDTIIAIKSENPTMLDTLNAANQI